MSIVERIDLDNIINTSNTKSYLTISERNVPRGANNFFKKIINKPFNINGKVFKKSCVNDIKDILEDKISIIVKNSFHYNLWINDMAKMSTIFCDIMGTNDISFSLGTSRGCSRYHIDNVPLRLLVTYYGQGTEWLPTDNADYEAYSKGKDNENILKDPKKRMYLKPWHISIFKGGSDGILHRTPDSALKSPSLLMRLDHSTFLNDIEKYNTLKL
tara:strand:- start:2483 stop:3127 length:645 start_codon:yes stop_codon:yes gene_type:complete